MTRILLVDPDVLRRERLARALGDHGVEAGIASDSEDLLTTDLTRVDAVVSHTDLRSGDGVAIRGRIGNRPLILFTDRGDVRRAVDAMRRGAADYLVAPFEPGELVESIARSLERSVASPQQQSVHVPMVGHCPAMLDLYERIDVLAHSDAPLLIRGESGSGKELVARAVHAASARRAHPMIALNCATIPTTLMESELFGDKGADDQRRGLIEAADGSTLFLDEIGSLTIEVQARLLSLMQDRDADVRGARPIDVRIIAATHRDLAPLVDAGRFSAGLYERLIATALTVPPLRERGSDITELANRLLRRICHKLSKPELTLSGAALDAIARYDWPGNVRELENALERAVILCDTGIIEPELLAIELPKTAPTPPPADESDGDTSLERYFVKFVLDHQDDMTETQLASKLGISRKSLWERRQRLNIPRKRISARALRRDEAH
jgi:DNA-binding NtrC family response regulator